MYCKNCNNVLKTSYKSNGYLAVDVENQVNEISLHSISENLIAYGSKYLLAGVIGYEKNQMTDRYTYIAYCRLLNSNWIRKQGIKNKSVKLKKIQKINLSLLFYIKIVNSSEG